MKVTREYLNKVILQEIKKELKKEAFFGFGKKKPSKSSTDLTIDLDKERQRQAGADDRASDAEDADFAANTGNIRRFGTPADDKYDPNDEESKKRDTLGNLQRGNLKVFFEAVDRYYEGNKQAGDVGAFARAFLKDPDGFLRYFYPRNEVEREPVNSANMYRRHFAKYVEEKDKKLPRSNTGAAAFGDRTPDELEKYDGGEEGWRRKDSFGYGQTTALDILTFFEKTQRDPKKVGQAVGGPAAVNKMREILQTYSIVGRGEKSYDSAKEYAEGTFEMYEDYLDRKFNYSEPKKQSRDNEKPYEPGSELAVGINKPPDRPGVSDAGNNLKNSYNMAETKRYFKKFLK